MKLNCDYFKDRRRRLDKEQQEWHRHFAIICRVGKSDCRVLETVERRLHLEITYWGGEQTVFRTYQYRAINNH